ncbi:MAG: Ig-like domain-containing protein, partial [Clostridia bacterium]|nr:Ig-like domain-containing protein [Clostridia bacterium]
MNLFKRITAAAIAVICIATLLCACGGGEKEYTVTLKDHLGNPYTSGIVVEFIQNGSKIAMQACDENGVATKTLAAGDYNISLKFSGDDVSYKYDESISVTSKQRSVDVVLSKAVNSEPVVLNVVSVEYDAYPVSVGCTYVELDEGRNYYIFTPTEAGTYEFSIADGTDATVGYYGAPHYVQENNNAEVVDGKFTISVSDSMIGTGEGGTSNYVLGVDKNKADACVLGIQRIGDPAWSIEDEPWEIYQKTSKLEAYTLPEGYVFGEFDITKSTDSYKIVFNESDGFYHLDSADGPLVLVRLAEDCDYIACFKTILDRSGVTRYYFDDNDEFVKKVSFSECLLEYIEYVDENEGVYPLTEDLKYIIQTRGEYVGWWDIESSGYIYKDLNGANDPS